MTASASTLKTLRAARNLAWETYFANKTPANLAAFEAANDAFRAAGGQTND